MMNKKQKIIYMLIIIISSIIGLIGVYANQQNNISSIKPTLTPSPSPIVTSSPEPSIYDASMQKLTTANFTVITADMSRSNGLSSSLTKVSFSSIDDFITFCQSQHVSTIFFYQGRLFDEGLLPHYWNWYYIDGSTIYYYKYQYYFGV